MKHARSCPVSTGAAKNRECTCGVLDPVPPGTKLELPEMTPGPAQGAVPPKDTDDGPYRDAERARELAQRAEKAFESGESARAEFLLRLSTEARLLADLLGKWEY